MESLKRIIGINFEDLKLKRKEKVIPLATIQSGCKINDVVTHVDTTLLYQRIIRCVESEEDFSECFKYELSPMPPSLFDEMGMRKSNKSTLYGAFIATDEKHLDKKCTFVIDGGFLLHCVLWLK